MHNFVLQDWTLLSGGAGVNLTQDETGWLDLAPFQDAVFYIDCRQQTNSPTLGFETAPAKDDALFQSMGSVTLAVGATPSLVRALMLTTANAPLARYVRWKITAGAGAWNASFRVFVAANAPGM